jgi:hypothetical protein
MKKPKFSSDIPKCADSEIQYKEWFWFARHAPAQHGFCTDCTPEYQAQMIREYRCENPAVFFKQVGSGGFVGVLSDGSDLLETTELEEA